jgi:carboxylesterase type B
VFHALPYALPPTGSLRFKAPVPIDINRPSSSDGAVRDASKTGPVCIQGHPAWEFLDNGGQPPAPWGSEDCLTLDVIAPSGAFKDGRVIKKLPVVIKIHGGGYTMGGSDWTNALTLMPHAKDSMVFVAIQYRLGPLGFLGGEAVRGEGGASNAGLLDQRAAIEWVRRNIAKFGGDPEKVTIWGGSAGGGSVTAQMMMYGGEKNPPFRNAVGEYPWWQPYHGEAVSCPLC